MVLSQPRETSSGAQGCWAGSPVSRTETTLIFMAFCSASDEWCVVDFSPHLVSVPCPRALQQKLEERQADVEYELRCLLNKQGYLFLFSIWYFLYLCGSKPLKITSQESDWVQFPECSVVPDSALFFFLRHNTLWSLHTECDWTQDDRGKEQCLMDELVAIIDQRNQIISSLDQDLQRYTGNRQTDKKINKQ